MIPLKTMYGSNICKKSYFLFTVTSRESYVINLAACKLLTSHSFRNDVIVRLVVDFKDFNSVLESI